MSHISTTLGIFLIGNGSIEDFVGFGGFLGHRVQRWDLEPFVGFFLCVII